MPAVIAGVSAPDSGIVLTSPRHSASHRRAPGRHAAARPHRPTRPRRPGRPPVRLTLGVAAATSVAAAGALIGVVAAGSGAPPGGAGGLDAIGQAAPEPAASGAAASARTALSGAPSARPAAPSSPSSRPAASPSARPRPAAAPAQPYLIYDSVIPSGIPAGKVVATYADGPGASSPSQVAGRANVLWIDINGSDPAASVIDVEPGNASPAQAASWARQRLTDHPDGLARIYTMLSEWPAVQDAVASLPSGMRARIRWWIANPTGSPHIVPGSDATQWYWGPSYDISTATPRF